MNDWLRQGVEGRRLSATLRLYLFGLMFLAPYAAVAGFLFDAEAAAQVTIMLAFVLVAVEWLVCVHSGKNATELAGGHANSPDRPLQGLSLASLPSFARALVTSVFLHLVSLCVVLAIIVVPRLVAIEFDSLKADARLGEAARSRLTFDISTDDTHVLAGLRKAAENPDIALDVIQRAETFEKAKRALAIRLDISEVQALAILELPLQRLARSERENLIEGEGQVLAARGVTQAPAWAELRDAMKNFETATHLIRQADTPRTAALDLAQRFGLSEIQAKALLDMPLLRLTRQERAKLIDGRAQEVAGTSPDDLVVTLAVPEAPAGKTTRDWIPITAGAEARNGVTRVQVFVNGAQVAEFRPAATERATASVPVPLARGENIIEVTAWETMGTTRSAVGKIGRE